MRRENRVEPRPGGAWVVEGEGGCPHCRAEFRMLLEIPLAFCLQLIAEGERRERVRAGQAASLPPDRSEG